MTSPTIHKDCLVHSRALKAPNTLISLIQSSDKNSQNYGGHIMAPASSNSIEIFTLTFPLFYIVSH